MIIEGVPSDLLQLEESVCVFSDDSRFIYIHSSSSGWKGFSNNIAVFDTLYNKFILLSPDESVKSLYTIFNGFFDGTWRPNTCIIDNKTLLILFKSSHSNEYINAALLIVIELNFCKNSYSLVDYKLISDCESANLVINENNNKFLLIHEFEVGAEVDHPGITLLGYYTFSLQDGSNKISEIQRERRITFDYDYANAGYLFLWHIFDNKLWFFRHHKISIVHHISYFDLTEDSPKCTPIEVIEDMEELMFQWSGKCLLRYSQLNGELSIFDLENCQWKKNYQCNELRNLETNGSHFMSFWKSNTFGCKYNSVEWHFENDFNTAMLVNSTKKQLIKIPINKPFKLIEFAWTNVLNYGLLPELEKKGLNIYPRIF